MVGRRDLPSAALRAQLASAAELRAALRHRLVSACCDSDAGLLAGLGGGSSCVSLAPTALCCLTLPRCCSLGRLYAEFATHLPRTAQRLARAWPARTQAVLLALVVGTTGSIYLYPSFRLAWKTQRCNRSTLLRHVAGKCLPVPAGRGAPRWRRQGGSSVSNDRSKQPDAWVCPGLAPAATHIAPMRASAHLCCVPRVAAALWRRSPLS